MKINWKRLGQALLILAALWALNYNNALGRRDDNIKNCRLSADLVTNQNRRGWVAAERARQAAYEADGRVEDKIARNTYHEIHSSLDRFLALSCEEKWDMPSLVTGR